MSGTDGSQARPAPPRLTSRSGDRSRTAAAAFCLMVCLTIATVALGAKLAMADRAPVAVHADREAEANTTLVARFYAEVWNGGRLTGLADYIANDHAYHDPSSPATPAGPDGVAQRVAALRRVFPDLALTLDDVAAQGDRVTVRFTAHGTQRGTFLGAAGTDRTIEATGIAVHRLVDGQIAETWVSWDTFGIAQQVGLVLLPVAALGEWEGAPGRGQRGFEPY